MNETTARQQIIEVARSIFDIVSAVSSALSYLRSGRSVRVSPLMALRHAAMGVSIRG